MSDEIVWLSSELSSNEEGKSSSSKNAQKRKLPDSSFNDHKKKVVKRLVAKTKLPTNSDDAFQTFIKICLERRNDDDTKKVLQRLQKLYSKLSSFHKNDDKLKLFINTCHKKITKNLARDIYSPILELRTEIKNRIETKLEDEGTSDNEVIIEELEMLEENKRKIKKLEECIIQCRKKIKELEEREVDFDEDEDSAYIQEDRYKKKLIQLCHYLSKLNRDKAMRGQILKKKLRRKDIPGEMTGISLLDEAIISLINSEIGKINRMKHLETQRCADLVKMPEYLDVLQCIRKCNKNSDLGLSDEKITKSAKRAFEILVNFLKKKRINDTKLYMQFLIDDKSEDPAEKDVELRNKLWKNKTEGDKKLEKIFKKYIDKQRGLDEEDSEKKAKRSSEDDEDDNETVAENKTSAPSPQFDRKHRNHKDKKDEFYQKKKKIIETNTIEETALKSKETVKNNTPTETVFKSKEVVKDNNTVTETTHKSQETLKKNAVSETVLGTVLKAKETFKNNTNMEKTPKSKEGVKDKTVIETTLEFKETSNNNADSEATLQDTLKNDSIRKTAYESTDSKNRITSVIVSKNVEKTTQITNNEDDIVVIDSSDDDCMEVEYPHNTKKWLENNVPTVRATPETKVTVKIDMQSSPSISPAITSTPLKADSHDTLSSLLPKKLVDVAKVDDSNKVKTAFIKVRAFAKSPPAWIDDDSIVKSPWLSDDEDESNRLDIKLY